jgi:hypothetical protein
MASPLAYALGYGIHDNDVKDLSGVGSISMASEMTLVSKMFIEQG